MNTPLTDAKELYGFGPFREKAVHANFARKLERDRARLIDAANSLRLADTDEQQHAAWNALFQTITSLEADK